MYGDSTDAEMALKINKALEMQTQESVEILVYQKNSEFIFERACPHCNALGEKPESSSRVNLDFPLNVDALHSMDHSLWKLRLKKTYR